MEPVDSQRDIMRIGKNFVVKAKPVRSLVTGEVVKNDSCALEILRASDGQAFSKVDIELSCLPSRSLSAAYGIVYLTNFKVSAVERTALEVTILEQVAFDAIRKFYHESVSVLTTPTWFDALDNKVGLSSLMAFAKRFNLKLNTKVGTIIRESARQECFGIMLRFLSTFTICPFWYYTILQAFPAVQAGSPNRRCYYLHS